MADATLALFENSRSDWNLQVTSHEMRRIMQTVHAMGHRVSDPVVWVQKIGPATRRWWSNTFKLNMFFDTAGTESDPPTPVAVPLSFLTAVYQLTETYGSASIFLNLDEDALTASSGGEYVVVDETVDITSEPPFDPRFMDRVSGHRRFEKVSVRSDVLDRIVSQYRTMRGTVEITDGPPAFLKISAGRDAIRWTADWSRWGRARMSGYSVASTWINHFEVTFFPESLFTFLTGILYEEELVLGTVAPEFSEGEHVFAVIGLDWAAWCPVDNENWERWDDRITAAFEEFGFGFEGEPHFSSDWSEGEVRAFGKEDVEILVSIMDGAAGPDCVRLRYAVDHNCLVTMDLMKEVMEVNESLVGARLLLDGNEMSLIVDIDNPTGHDEVVNAIKSMLAAIGRVSGLESLLPLFGSHRPKDELDREIDEILESADADDESYEDDDPED